MKKKIYAATPMMCLIIFLLLGFVWGYWHPGWMVFLLIPFMPILLNLKKFLFSYSTFTLIIYLILGFGWHLWHPAWIIFLTIPVFYIFFPKKTVAEAEIVDKD